MPKVRKAASAKFTKQESYTPRNRKEKFLTKALLSTKNEKEMAHLLRDLLTLPEIEVFANRLEMARMLYKGHSYQEVAKKAGVSTTTVTRVAHWLFSGCGGYQTVLRSLTKKEKAP